MKSWNIDLSKPINLEGKLIGVSLFENEHGFEFADLKIVSDERGVDDVELPVSPLHTREDVNFMTMVTIDIIKKKVSYTREVVNDWGDSVMVAYRLEVMEEGGPLYAQVVKLKRQK